MSLLVGLAMLAVAKKPVIAIAQRSIDDPLTNAMTGFIVLFLALPAAAVLFLTVIGIPLALIILLLWGIALYIAKIFVAIGVANWLLGKQKTKKIAPGMLYRSLAVGLIGYFIIRAIPLVGPLFVVVVTAIGLGALISEWRGVKPATTNEAAH